MTDNNKASVAVHIDAVRKVYDNGFVALESISLDIRDNEFFTLLGPSGCGKTTLLRCIAGFEDVSDGRIVLHGEEIDHLPPDQRPVNTVFQHYSLFPHMTIAENVGFSLKMLKKPQAEIDRVVAEMLALIKMEEYGRRKPHQLSGGQQQRIALARALAPKPQVLLLDEPLSALDLKLRQAMRSELKRIQGETGITFVFVTHDQEEAMAMSDRIAVMSQGKVQQLGAPKAIYERPVNRFVANFIGDSNLLDARVESHQPGHIICRHGDLQFTLHQAHSTSVGADITLAIRPEKITLVPLNEASASGHVESVIYMGTDTLLSVRIDTQNTFEVRCQNTVVGEEMPAVGDRIGIHIAAGSAAALVD